MGAWGPGPFDNDDAMDLLLAYEERGTDALREVLAQPDDRQGDGFIDADLGGRLIALGEIVAACHGHPMRGGPSDFPMGADPERFKVQMAAHASDVRAEPALLAGARGAVNGLLANPKVSELAGLWQEGQQLDAFARTIADLEARLAKAAAS
ncbi:DUF4259 domain-containing protein [Pseudoroseicyclus sp. CXY001]|uniref:DUF4259 domain-containing protein n=1 Tax=Pseudoroseicyclus sp. CXY001 TaxID=3242492 RepID=UPI00358DC4B0